MQDFKDVEETSQDPKFMSIADYAKANGVAVSTVYSWINSGKIDCQTFGKVKLIQVK